MFLDVRSKWVGEPDYTLSFLLVWFKVLYGRIHMHTFISWVDFGYNTQDKISLAKLFYELLFSVLPSRKSTDNIEKVLLHFKQILLIAQNKRGTELLV